MSGRIEKVTLDCFRGASGHSEICFDKNKPLVMIFGENGTGKSTIVDAIDFIANGSLGSLEDRSVGSGRHAFVKTIGTKPADLRITLASGGAVWTGVLSGRDAKVTGGNGPLRVSVLRRARLLKLIEAEPKQRYETLRSFIEVGGVEAAEQALRDALKNAQVSFEQTSRLLSEASDALNQLWMNEGRQGTSAEDWAKLKAEADISDLKALLERLDRISKSLAQVEEAGQRLAEAESSVQEGKQAVQSVQAEVAQLPPIAGAKAVEMLQLLQLVQSIIAEPNQPTTCPVCEQAVNAASLRGKVSSRLDGMSQHQQVAQRQTKAESNLNSAQAARDKAITAMVKRVREACLLIKNGQHELSWASQATWDVAAEALLDSTDETESQLAVAQKLAAMVTALKAACDKHLQAVQSDVMQHNAIKGHYDRITQYRKTATELERLVARMKSALSTCEDERRKFTQGILDAVATESARLYSIIHPNEPLGSPRLTMDPNKRGSVDQDAEFAGHTVPPQAYYSESHLDTLGFCVWLAIAKRRDPKEVVIILDDVFTSIDGVHLSRIMRLLNEVVGEFAQVIVTTHYRTWRDRYRLYQAPGQCIQLMELHRWTLNRGVCVSGTKLAADDLETAIATNPLDRQAVASQSGILLEAMLDRLTLLYRRKVPRTRDGDLTLGDLLSSCNKLLNALKVEYTPSAMGPTSTSTIAVEVKPFLEDSGPLMFIRNQVGCHFNLTGGDVPDNDVEAFGKTTVALTKAMICPECGDLPDRADGTHFRCSCGKTKMTPLAFDK